MMAAPHCGCASPICVRAALAEELVAYMRDRRARGFSVPIKVGEILDAIAETDGSVPVESSGTGITRG